MDEENNVNETNQFVVFKLEKEEYGIDIHKVTTIERLTNITRVPKTADYIKGVMSLRGEVVPVIDLRKRFHLPPTVETDESRIVVIKVDDVILGMIVDTVHEVVSVLSSNIESVNNISTDHYSNYIFGIGKIGERIITLLNLKSLIESIQL